MMSDPETITITLDRRGFLSGICAAFASAPLTGIVPINEAKTVVHVPYRATFQGMAYISFDGTGVPYEAPQGSRSTRDYVNSLSREEYLRRHWLT